jgi:DNA-binding MarR family transcriptional regulator
MLNILKKIRDLKNSTTTYNFGVLQTKVYRLLKSETDRVLKPYGISTVEWALLGLLYDNKEPLKLIQTAEVLGVEPPFVTAIADELEKQGFMLRTNSKEDKRAKLLELSSKGKKLVEAAEPHIRKETKFLLEGVGLKEMLTYRSVLVKILENYENRNIR